MISTERYATTGRDNLACAGCKASVPFVAFAITLPIPPTHRAGGPSIVEFGVTDVEYVPLSWADIRSLWGSPLVAVALKSRSEKGVTDTRHSVANKGFL